MTQNETDDPEIRTRDRLREWTAEPAGITKGWLLLSVVLGWVFLACALYAAVRTVQLDNRVAEDQIRSSIEQQVLACESSNVTRVEARLVALADVDEDRRIWTSIDTLFDGGIPEPTRTVVFDALEVREDRINETYIERDCALIRQETP